ncbi:MAG TPA: alpha/beta hydrolase [Steroidobacteraceae bacterium]|jgi:pimeloyl-ACP methyl ester carboxylesterase|nr:alpha/beta hydrolase [Steroidobacteraceae bacterium]
MQAMDALRYQTVSANGIDFNVAVAGSADRLALCLHGFPESSFSWRHQIPLLAQLGYRVWAPDLRGYGGSSRPIGVNAYSLEHLEADVAALIEAAGAKEVLLIGHDWGALIAWHYAMFGRLPISRLIIMNVPHPTLAEKGLRTRRQLAKSWYIFFFQLPWIPEWMLARNHCAAIGRAFRGMAVDKTRFPDEVLRVYQNAAAEPGALTAMLNYYRALIRFPSRTRHRGAPRIETPTLMLWGEVDTALGKELSFGTDEYVSNLTLRYLPNVSHWVQQEAPETVNGMIEAWLLGKSVPYAKGGQPPGAGPSAEPGAA